jgi:hypothetical protein
LPLPATDKAMSAWVLQADAAVIACDIKRQLLVDAWPKP